MTKVPSETNKPILAQWARPNVNMGLENIEKRMGLVLEHSLSNPHVHPKELWNPSHTSCFTPNLKKGSMFCLIQKIGGPMFLS
jgi:hypothetical protein